MSETVDRTYVISLQRMPKDKDSFVSGFPDGRIKFWKKEKSGNKVVLKTLRTINSAKVQNLVMLTPSIMALCGQDKIVELYNMETQQKIK